MYIPGINREDNLNAMLAFMHRYSFATIVNSQGNQPVATHLPFVIQKNDACIKLISHFARANKQWQLIEQVSSLVIFSEPHAYISPRHYESKSTVPTWNYISVHAYGRGCLITEKNAVRAILEQTIHNFESDYLLQWNGLSEDFKTKMAQGIVAFEITVDDLQGKKKLSQNKTEAEQKNIIASLSASNNAAERDIAAYMQGELNKSSNNLEPDK